MQILGEFMRFLFKNAGELTQGISIVASDLGIELCNEEPDFEIYVNESDTAELCVRLNGDCAEISYGGGRARFFRGLATLVGWIRDGVKDASVKETPCFENNGPMVDMSRNSVMTVDAVEFMMRKCALMGLNTFMLYTEDTYELGDYPFFGYMRGRYTVNEIRELDSYADTLGIELIPCIQVLGHLATHLRWPTSESYKDTSDVLLVGSEQTYKLIDAMLKFAKDAFATNKIHIGMDETFALGVGEYLRKNGYRERVDIYLEHLNKVAKMAHGYGLKPMMWSDMFFRMAGRGLEKFRDYDERVVIPDEVAAMVPDGVQMVFWEYAASNEEFYLSNLEKHDKLGKGTAFAGSVKTWSTLTPAFENSRNDTIPALSACKKKGVKDVIATVWNNGGTCNLMLSLPGIAWFADFDYKGEFDEASAAKTFENASVGSSYADFMNAGKLSSPRTEKHRVSVAALYNDPMLGLVDGYYKSVDARAFYKELSSKLSDSDKRNGEFGSSFRFIKCLSALFEKKVDFGIRLKAAYDAKDIEALRLLADECLELKDLVSALHEANRDMWFETCKPFGWEVYDIRYGGLVMRFETARKRILEYLDGKVAVLAELAAERLNYMSNRYEMIITGGQNKE